MPSDPSEARVVTEREGGVGWIIFDNVGSLNALTPEMIIDLGDAMEGFAADDDVRVVVLRGAGDRAFSAGADLKGGATPTQRAGQRRSTMVPPIDKPVIAMIHGVCIGGGLAAAIEADVRIAADDARFGIPVARLGFAYSFETVSRVVALVGPAAASMLSFTADIIDAAEALRIGLVDRVVAKEDLDATVLALAQRIAHRAPLSVRASKVTIRASSGDRPEEVERCRAMIAACMASDDAIEGRAAFVEKREPRFRGR